MFTSPNAEHWNQWIEALRSGTYRQGTGRLVTLRDDSDPSSERAYCCLGLGSLISGCPMHVERSGMSLDDGTYGYAIEFGYNHSNSLAPVEFIEWLGWRTNGSQADVEDANEYNLEVLWGEVGELPARPGTIEGPATRQRRLRRDGQLTTLAGLNDAGFSFSQIADMACYFGVHPLV